MQFHRHSAIPASIVSAPFLSLEGAYLLYYHAILDAQAKRSDRGRVPPDKIRCQWKGRRRVQCCERGGQRSACRLMFMIGYVYG